jgi:hypothetical protein
LTKLDILSKMSNSMGENYKLSYLAAVREAKDLLAQLRLLEERRAEVEKRLMEIKRVILALAPLCDEDSGEIYHSLFPETEGLSNAVWKVLTQVAAGAWISPVTVREQLLMVGYETKSKNILPSIHNVLKRFRDEGTVETKTMGHGKWYRSKPMAPTADNTSAGQSGKQRKQKPR